nr:calcineurin-like phosphoesterase family protein [uncultured Carboxylicivirga sp.]
MKYIKLIIAFSFVLSFVVGQEKENIAASDSNQETKSVLQAKGFIFNDANQNGVKDNSEKGIGGVLVSNGIDIVKTDKKGKYEIPVSDDAVIFVIKPAGWMTPLNEYNLPQFYYLRKEKGSPDNYKFKGIEPTGELPNLINFPLYPKQESDVFKVLVFGDTQPYNLEQVDFLAEDIITELVDKNDILFGMTMGDVVGDNLNLYKPLNETINQIGIPWYNVMGNHDVNYMSPDDKQSDDTFKRVYGPSTYAFVYGKVHFIVLDDILHHEEVGSTKYEGGLRPEQLTFVSNYLKEVPKEDLVVLNMHIPFDLQGRSFRSADQDKLFDLLKDFPNTLSISGHTHLLNNYYFNTANSSWQQNAPHHHFNAGATCGSWWCGLRNENDVPHTMMRDGVPNGYAFVNFNGTDYVIDWKVAGGAEDHQMNIYVPRGVVAHSSDTTLLTVNFFKGCEQSQVKYRIKGQTNWKEMKRVEKFDPYYEKIAQRWLNFKKINLDKVWLADSTLTVHDFPGSPLIGPAKTNHIWEANIGTDFDAGRYIIEVEAKDRYGRTFTAYQSLRIEEQ